MRKYRKLSALGFLIILITICTKAESKCSQSQSCLALASYYLWNGATLSYIALVLESDLVNPNDPNYTEIRAYNPIIKNPDVIQMGSRLIVPFTCECLEGEFFGGKFEYSVQTGDTYGRVARLVYSNLTTSEYLEFSNSYPANMIPAPGGVINVTVNCSCGDRGVSEKYGLFVTYPLRFGESLRSVARESGVEEDLVQRYNPGVDFSSGKGIVYVPGKDKNGTFPPLALKSSEGLRAGAITGITVAVIVGLLLLGGGAYMFLYCNRKYKQAQLLSSSQELSNITANASKKPWDEASASTLTDGGSPLIGITMDKSVEFSYEELAKATDNFSIANKIGQGGFGAVYYAELRGEKGAIKKMDMQASREFLAELKVLTHVHHVNLVRLIGYCVEGCLFLVYEYIENGNLSQHLHGRGKDPLPWPVRVKVALDSARGLEYIHEHTVPAYIHRDIKPANILIDKKFRGKVADFGLTKLTDMGGTTRLVGTFGYMPPEYARYGDVSPKVDVYAFGVVLYELISAKQAIVRTDDSAAEHRGLVATFENVLNQADPKEDLCKLVDPRLGDDYPYDSVYKVAQLARACTHEDPEKRPSMRTVVVALMTLSSSTDDWDIGGFYENQALVNLMTGR